MIFGILFFCFIVVKLAIGSWLFVGHKDFYFLQASTTVRSFVLFRIGKQTSRHPTTRKECLGQHNFFSNDIVKKKYSCKADTFPQLQKKFQKITMKINIIGTCPNFQLSFLETLVF
jgi:hypothetical protein